MTVSTFFQDTLFFSPAALTTAATSTDALQVAVQDTAACQNFVFQIKVSSIGTNVVVRAEGSLDGTNTLILALVIPPSRLTVRQN